MPSGHVSPLVQSSRQLLLFSRSQNGVAVPVAAGGQFSSLVQGCVQSPMTAPLSVPLRQDSVSKHTSGPLFTQSA